jgi:Domain of unknown function (DUF6285)
MSRDRPDVVEIIKTVDEFIAQLVDRLDGRERYDALCARYLLGIAERELTGGAGIDRTERRRLETFLGEAGSVDELYASLAASIRAGGCDSRWEEVFELVLGHVINKVAVSRGDQLDSEHRAVAARVVDDGQ